MHHRRWFWFLFSCRRSIALRTRFMRTLVGKCSEWLPSF
jgi:hypothetical protein